MKGIIFDLDGTLYDSLEDIGSSANRTLKKYSYPEHPMESYQEFVGNGLKMTITRAIPKNVVLSYEILNDFLTDYEHNHTVFSKPYPGILSMLKSLNEMGIPVGICTNKKQAYSEGIVAKDFKGIEFVSVIGDLSNNTLKPNPLNTLRIAEMMNLKPEEIYFVGDTDVDMHTAKNAGMVPIGVSWGFREVEELEREGATTIINYAEEIVGLFTGGTQ